MTAAELTRQIEVSEQQRADLLPPQSKRQTGRAWACVQTHDERTEIQASLHNCHAWLSSVCWICRLVICRWQVDAHRQIHKVSKEQQLSELVQKGIQCKGAQVYGSPA